MILSEIFVRLRSEQIAGAMKGRTDIPEKTSSDKKSSAASGGGDKDKKNIARENGVHGPSIELVPDKIDRKPNYADDKEKQKEIDRIRDMLPAETKDPEEMEQRT